MTVPRVVVAGDANLDLVLRGDVRPRFGQTEQLLQNAELVLGSSAGICAAGLARLDVTVALCARVGDDHFGTETTRLLRDGGVHTGEVRIADGPTGLSVILSDGDDRSILTLTGVMAALSPDEVFETLASFEATHLHVASFFLLPTLAAALPSVLAGARAAGITTSLDTNWDPSDAWLGVNECLPYLDLLMPNTSEAVAIARSLGLDAVGGESAARALAARGPTVAVKDGARGGFVAQGDELIRAPGLQLSPVDTTGAGDSFDAGFLAAWTVGRSVAESLQWATVAGSLSTRAAGGTGAQATRREIEAAVTDARR